MPHVVYLAAAILCPWPGCRFQIELVDFQLEHYGDAGLYAQVMAAWGRQADFGLIGRCPGCGQHVLFGLDTKATIADLSITGLPVLPDDWHARAYIA